MTTSDLLLSLWSVHPAALALAAVLVGVTALRWRIAARAAARPFAFLALAIVVLLLALLSPLDALANGVVFSAHMLQHLLLLLVVPPLFLLSIPFASAPSPGLPRSDSRGTRLLTHPAATWLAGVGAMWFWHVPTLCSAATIDPILRTVQAISLVLAGTLFWLPILGPCQRRLPPLGGVLYLFTACIGCTLLGIIITFSPVSVCPAFSHPADPSGVLQLVRQGWGLTPAIDQQIGGLLMWVPACSIYACGIVALLVRWYAEAGEEAPQADAITQEGDGTARANQLGINAGTPQASTIVAGGIAERRPRNQTPPKSIFALEGHSKNGAASE